MCAEEHEKVVNGERSTAELQIEVVHVQVSPSVRKLSNSRKEHREEADQLERREVRFPKSICVHVWFHCS
jgi:hypothetical protein